MDRLRWTTFALIGAVIVTSVLLAVDIIRDARKSAEMALGNTLSGIVRVYARGIDGPSFSRLFLDGDRVRPAAEVLADPEFEKLRTGLRNTISGLASSGLNQDNLYLFAWPGKGRPLSWAVMAHPKPFTGEVYQPTEVILEVLEGRTPFAISSVYLSKASNKEWISAYAPITDGQRIVGLVEAAFGIEVVLRETATRMQRQLLVLAGILLLAAIAVTVIFSAVRTLSNKNQELQTAYDRTEESRKLYRTVVEGGNDIIFLMDSELKILSANRALRTHLGITPDSVLGRSFPEVFLPRLPDTEKVTGDAIIEGLRALSPQRLKFQQSTQFMTALTGDARDFRITFEFVEGSERAILGRAILLQEDTLIGSFERSREIFKLSNSLTAAENLSDRVANMLRRYMGNRIAGIRVALREMLLNAMEHGNLAITFDEKTEAQAAGTYFDLLRERREAELYRDRKVTFECVIDARKAAFRITDMGDGFDHKAMIRKVTEGTSELEHGRGILMTLAEFDAVRYNDRGNSVVLVKYFEAHSKVTS